MTNQELERRFAAITKQNTFDRYISLRHFKKEYKNSDFYKQTRCPLHKAYKIYLSEIQCAVLDRLNLITNKDYIIEYFKDLFEEGKINEAIENFVNNFISQVSVEEMEDMRGQINKLLDKWDIK